MASRRAVFADEAHGIDMESELAVVTGDVAMGATADAALEAVRLVLLANDWSLRTLVPAEVASGFGFLQSKPATAFAPVAVTPDELGPAWRGGRVHLKVATLHNGKRLGEVDGGPGMHFHFGQLIAHLARTRNVRAGAIVGSGTVSHDDESQGVSCLAELRAPISPASMSAMRSLLWTGTGLVLATFRTELLPRRTVIACA